ncbi:MAG: hypothetical protein IT472_08800 [Thermomonas sp.]|uniref:hypothetical protein n=1 Tax=Thermomonas sp. TaxID=1971895 RepID=UPI0026041A5C|nr:hypothetical protein [Thermomonas sp.]MCC7097263.1 hypothetical protein [Thermomonas sp.]
MASVDPVFAQWLQDGGLWLASSDAVLVARWGAKAVTAERMTCLATLAGATAEQTRRAGFFGVPMAVEQHLLTGQWLGFIGQVISISGPQLGYGGGVDVFVIGAEDNRATGLSSVTVLRRLA